MATTGKMPIVADDLKPLAGNQPTCPSINSFTTSGAISAAR